MVGIAKCRNAENPGAPQPIGWGVFVKRPPVNCCHALQSRLAPTFQSHRAPRSGNGRNRRGAGNVDLLSSRRSIHMSPRRNAFAAAGPSDTSSRLAMVRLSSEILWAVVRTGIALLALPWPCAGRLVGAQPRHAVASSLRASRCLRLRLPSLAATPWNGAVEASNAAFMKKLRVNHGANVATSARKFKNF